MFARTVRLAAAFGLGAVLVSCSSAPPVSAPTRVSVPLPEEVHAGEMFEIQDQQGTTFVHAAIDAVRVDAVCGSQHAEEPRRRQHELAVLMTFNTTAQYRNAELHLTGPPESADFRVVGPNGTVDKTVKPLSSEGCADEGKAFREPLQPSTHYRGWVLLQTEFVQGTLYYRPQGAMSLPGWEIDFPAGNGR